VCGTQVGQQQPTGPMIAPWRHIMMPTRRRQPRISWIGRRFRNPHVRMSLAVAAAAAVLLRLEVYGAARAGCWRYLTRSCCATAPPRAA
jgi:hypothetical protein